MLPPASSADPAPAPTAERSSDTDAERWAAHGQLTYTEQESNDFNDPYRGTNSLSPGRGAETIDGTFSVGARLAGGTEAWISLEVDQGFGLNDTVGLAGFSSGEAYKVGRNSPYLRLPRVFLRDTINVGDTTEAVAAGATQLAGTRSQDAWVLTIGKFSVTDIFDANQYAHDSKVDFLNWTAIDAGTFDYAADAWSYTVGAALERFAGPWTVRLGLFDLSTIPNSTHLDPGGHEFQMLAEIERRYELGGQAGKALITVFDSRARMARLQDALALARETDTVPDVSKVRQYRSHAGVSASLEQALSPALGVFARVGQGDGRVEAYEFTDVDHSVSAGLAIKGVGWSRSDDTVGFAGIVNRISGVREAYLAAGGLGILVGDGELPHPGPEEILEAYYSWAVHGNAWLTVDGQRIAHPAYNRDRGPVTVIALRAHVAF
jgi:high affinity Mn2+ porin